MPASCFSSVIPAQPLCMAEVPEMQEQFPGKAGIQVYLKLDTRIRGYDEKRARLTTKNGQQ